MLKQILLIIYLSMAFCVSYGQQAGTISGVVTSADKKPLPHATATLLQAKTTIVLDNDGRFHIDAVQFPDTLIISHSGYITRRLPIIKTIADLSIVLDVDQKELQQVTIVSTGYQEIDRTRSTGSFEKVDNQLFNRKISPDILSRLDGIVPGILFDKRNSSQAVNKLGIQVRGLSTVLSEQAPLIILDNFPYEGDINAINPNDVEDITILKDAAAASIWGARAGNGVIVITTKKAKMSQRAALSINSNITVTGKPDLMKAPTMSSSDFIDVEKFLYDQGYYEGEITDIYTRPSLTPVVQLLDDRDKLLISPEEANQQIDALRQYDVRKDYLKYLYRSPIAQQYAAQLTGGSDQVRYLFSTGYDRGLGELRGNADERITLRLENTFTPLRNLQLHTGIFYTLNKSAANSPGGYGTINSYYGRSLYPYARLADDQGHALPVNMRYNERFADTAGGGLLYDWKYRPLEELEYADSKLRSQSLLANIDTRYKLSKSLSFEARYQYTRNNSVRNDLENLHRFALRDQINRFSMIQGSDVIYNYPNGKRLGRTTRTDQGYAVRGQLNYHKVFTGDNELNILAGAEGREQKMEGSFLNYLGYTDNLTTSAPSYNQWFMTYFGYEDQIYNDNALDDRLDRFVSLFANGSYSYRQKYTFTASGRRDASNILGVNTNRRFVPLWSAGAAWNISKEKFYRLGWLPFLKMRVTYGYSGNVNKDVTAVATIRVREASSSQFVDLPYASILTYPNQNARWEKVGTVNAGLDFAVKDNLLTGSIEYYQKKSIDLFGSQQLDPSVGVGTMQTNSAVLTGQGVDVSFLLSPFAATKVQWQANLLFSYTTNKLVKWLVKRNSKGYVSDGNDIGLIEGLRPYSVVSFQWGGLDPVNGNPLGILNGKTTSNLDSVVSHTPFENQVVHGSGIPQVYGGFRNTVTWKNLSLSVNVTYRLKYYYRRNTIDYSGLINYSQGHSDYALRWQKPGDELITNVPSFSYPGDSYRDAVYRYSTVTVERGDHVRLEDIRLDYRINIPGQKVFKNLRLYAMANQLNIILWKASESSADPNFTGGIIPGRSFSAGLSADF